MFDQIIAVIMECLATQIKSTQPLEIYNKQKSTLSHNTVLIPIIFLHVQYLPILKQVLFQRVHVILESSNILKLNCGSDV